MIFFVYGDHNLMCIHNSSNLCGFTCICMVVYLQLLCMTFGYVCTLECVQNFIWKCLGSPCFCILYIYNRFRVPLICDVCLLVF